MHLKTEVICTECSSCTKAYFVSPLLMLLYYKALRGGLFSMLKNLCNTCCLVLHYFLTQTSMVFIRWTFRNIQQAYTWNSCWPTSVTTFTFSCDLSLRKQNVLRGLQSFGILLPPLEIVVYSYFYPLHLSSWVEMASVSPQMQLVLLFVMLLYIPIDRWSMQSRWLPKVLGCFCF